MNQNHFVLRTGIENLLIGNNNFIIENYINEINFRMGIQFY